MSRLPSLNAIRAFEATARHLSITRAAEELHVTPGAVSRQIKVLEDALGVQLFQRTHRRIALTNPAVDYYHTVANAIGEIRKATQKLKKHGARQQLKILVYTTFAMRWLIPRLSDFHVTYPGIEVALSASLKDVDFGREELDAAIRLGDGNWPGLTSHRLVANELAPVCSPELLKKGPRLRSPQDLHEATLLHSTARLNDWAYWLKSQAVDSGVDSSAGMVYESSAMAYAAALEHQGVAIAQLFLVEDDLKSGRLVMPFNSVLDMGNYTYYLVQPEGQQESPSMRQFRTWLLRQASK